MIEDSVCVIKDVKVLLSEGRHERTDSTKDACTLRGSEATRHFEFNLLHPQEEVGQEEIVILQLQKGALLHPILLYLK
jgi:hypothetical protein